MVFTQTPTLVELMQVVHLVMHAITASRPRDEIVRAQLSIIASIFRQSKSLLPVSSLDSLKELVFVHPGVLKDVMMMSSSSKILQGNLNLLVSSLVLESPVQSGFLPKNGLTVTVTGLLFFSGVKKPDLTAMDRLSPVLTG